MKRRGGSGPVVPNSRRAIAFVRVSTAEQASEGYSLDSQRRRIAEFARSDRVAREAFSAGWEVERWFEAAGEPGEQGPRAEWNRMLDYVRRQPRTFGAILVYDLSRFSRDLEALLRARRQLHEIGVVVRSACEPSIDDTPEGWTAAVFAGMQANLFVLNLRRRMRQATIDSYEAGRWPHQPPPGYQKSGVPGVPTPAPRAFPLLREGFRRIADGERISAVWRGLRKRGLPTSRTRFHACLSNPFYCGVNVLRDGREVRGQWTEMIDRATFDAVQRRLHGDARAGRSYVKDNELFPLKGQAYCDCGRRLTGDAAARGKNPKVRPYYDCPTRGAVRANGQHVRVRPDELHAQVGDVLARLSTAPGFDAAEIRAAIRQRRDGVVRALHAERGRLQAVQRAENIAVTEYFAAPTDAVKALITRRIDELKAQHDAHADKITALEAEQRDQLADFEAMITAVQGAMTDLRGTWGRGSLRVRRAVVKLAFPKGLAVAVQPDGSTKIRTPVLANGFRLNRPISAGASRMASPAGRSSNTAAGSRIARAGVIAMLPRLLEFAEEIGLGRARGIAPDGSAEVQRLAVARRARPAASKG